MISVSSGNLARGTPYQRLSRRQEWRARQQAASGTNGAGQSASPGDGAASAGAADSSAGSADSGGPLAASPEVRTRSNGSCNACKLCCTATAGRSPEAPLCSFCRGHFAGGGRPDRRHVMSVWLILRKDIRAGGCNRSGAGPQVGSLAGGDRSARVSPVTPPVCLRPMAVTNGRRRPWQTSCEVPGAWVQIRMPEVLATQPRSSIETSGSMWRRH